MTGTKIKNIVFDLGQVILNVDEGLTSEAFKKLGVKGFDEIYSRIRRASLFGHFETGSITANEFRTELKKHLPNPANDRDVDDAWNAMLLDLPRERIHLLEQLKSKYRLFLLSNTNEIHLNAYSKILENSYGFKDLSHLFEKEYYSCKVGLRKPDNKIFRLVLSENGLIPGETLFIDDTKEHIETAKKLGIQTHLLKKGDSVLDIFRAVLKPRTFGVK